MSKQKAKPHEDSAEVQRERAIDRDLASIYSGTTDRQLATLEVKKRSRWGTFFLIFIPFLAIGTAIAWAGFVLFAPTPSFTGSKVGVEVKAPFSARAGEQVTYTIVLTNDEESALTKARLDVRLPSGFLFQTSSLPERVPETDPTNPTASLVTGVKTWDIADLFPGDRENLTITGILYAEPKTKSTVSATLAYTPQKFNSEFEETQSFTTEVTDSIVTITSDAPRQLADTEQGTFKFHITNTSTTQALGKLQVVAAYPERFTYGGSALYLLTPDSKEPAITPYKKVKPTDTDPATWDIVSLNPGETYNLTIVGSLSTDESTDRQFGLGVRILNPEGVAVTLTDTTVTTSIVKGNLLLRLIISGSEHDTPVRFGDTINYLINVQNTGKNVLGDVRVRMVTDSPLLIWATLVDQKKGVADQPQISWSKTSVSELETLLPGADISIPFSIKLVAYGDIKKKLSLDDFKIKSFAEAEIGTTDNVQTDTKITSKTVINELNSNAVADVYARYFDGTVTVGSGPLPPIVGQTTTYRIYWRLTNSLHELSDIKFEGKLPSGVTFADNHQVSAGNLYASGSTVVWEVNRMPESVAELTAHFDVSITPGDADAEKILSILGKTTVTATDAKTSGAISEINYGLTTNLDRDPQAKDKGLVKKD